MRNFQNTLKQNSILFATFFVAGNTIKYLLDASDLWYTAGSMSLGGIINSFTGFIAVFMLFILPFRPVRRFIWNRVFSKFYTNKNTVGTDSITKRFNQKPVENTSYETVDQKLSNNITRTKLSDNHVIVKIK